MLRLVRLHDPDDRRIGRRRANPALQCLTASPGRGDHRGYGAPRQPTPRPQRERRRQGNQAGGQRQTVRPDPCRQHGDRRSGPERAEHRPGKPGEAASPDRIRPGSSPLPAPVHGPARRTRSAAPPPRRPPPRTAPDRRPAAAARTAPSSHVGRYRQGTARRSSAARRRNSRRQSPSRARPPGAGTRRRRRAQPADHPGKRNQRQCDRLLTRRGDRPGQSRRSRTGPSHRARLQPLRTSACRVCVSGKRTRRRLIRRGSASTTSISAPSG